MKGTDWKRWGVIGLLVMGLLAVAYAFNRSQKSKNNSVPPDDRV